MNRVIRAKLLLEARDNPQVQALLMEKCSRDPVFWFNHFCFTHDPRTRQGKLPFFLYEFQEGFVRDLVAAIEAQEDVGVAKCRDMGASWLILLVFQWFWLFRGGNDFKVGSKKEDDVDKIGNINSLFEKLRFNIKNLPKWMLPEGFDSRKHCAFLKLLNPENSNVIAGESSNANFSRSGRFSAILFDEFAFWPFGDAAWTAASQSTPCRIATSTPNGKGNKYGRLIVGRDQRERLPKVIWLHWYQHPLKTPEWYEREKTRMTEDEFAREIDISFEMSVAGVVFKEFSPRAHLIKEPYKFEPMWKTCVSFDFGTTCCAVIAQRDQYDTLHVFKEIILYQNGNTEDLAQAYQNYVATLDIRGQLEYTGDPAASTRSHQTSQMTTDEQILAAAGIKPLQYSKARAMQDRLKGGIQLMKRMFSTRYQGKERIIIYEDGCPTLVEALQSEYAYKQDKNGGILDIINEKHPWEDPVDCLRYICIHWFNVEAGKRKVAADIEYDIPFAI